MECKLGSKVILNLPISLKNVSNAKGTEVVTPKRDASEYRELFACLFKIKDKDVQQRVLNAINNYPNNNASQLNGYCSVCKSKSITSQLSRQNSEKFTQTCDNDFEYLRSVNGDISCVTDSKQNNDNKNGMINDYEINKNEITYSTEQSFRFRFRKPVGPHAKKNDKKSTEQALAAARKKSEFKERIKQSPLLAKNNQFSSPTIYNNNNNNSFNENTKFDLDNSMPPLLGNECLQPNLSKIELVQRQMRLEWDIAFRRDETQLLPIHHAASKNDIKYLKRQMFVFNFLKADINVKSGNEGNTPLHFAILNDNLNECVKYLLENNANIMEKNYNGDTVLHYAAINTNNFQLFQYLLKKLKSINDLKSLNDNGSTILHTTISANKFHFTKSIIEYIDEQLNIKNDEQNISKQQELIEIYTKKINETIEQSTTSALTKLNSQKMEILNMKESLAGRTSLALAVNANNVCIALMLLAHYANPNVTDMAGENISSTTSRDVSDVINLAINRIDCIYKTNNWYDSTDDDDDDDDNDDDMNDDNVKNNKKRPHNDDMIFNAAKMLKLY